MIERRCAEDIAFRFLCANEQPDHSTIARFLADHDKELGDLFSQVLRLCVEVGLVKVGVVALDGTRVQADASPGANRSEDWIRKEVDKILAEARSTDEAEDQPSGACSANEIPGGPHRCRQPAGPPPGRQGTPRR